MAAENLDMNPPAGSDENPQAAGVATGPDKAFGLGRAAASKFRISPLDLLLIGLFASGLICLYLLSLRNGPQTASAEEQNVKARVEAALSQLGTVSDKTQADETSAIVDTFYYEAAQRQIPVERLSGNPFVYMPAVFANSSLLPNQNNADPAEIQKQQRLSDAMDAAKQLHLQSVLMGGQQATAMISNNLLTEGQIISGWTVKSIESRQVTLAWNDHEYVLKMPR